jgi:hypothetical protein
MPALQRLTAATGAAACALALTGSALAAPALVVRTSHLVRGAGPATIATREDPGTYRTTVSAPTAYRVANHQQIDKQIGTATVHVATAAGDLTFTGWIVGARPRNYVNDRCAAFAGDVHQAVWLVQVRQSDGLARAEIPVFVDQGPGGRTELTWCASSAADMTVTGVSLRFDRTFFNPVVAGTYAWNVRFDNAELEDASSATPNVLGAMVTTSATAVVRIRKR